MNIRIAICDDNNADLLDSKGIIQEVMEEFSISNYIEVYDSGEKLLESNMAFHLVFLDIALGGKNGIEIGRQVYRRNGAIKIIFQTGFSQFCIEAINYAHGFAFLEKPLDKEEVREQIIEFMRNYEPVDAI